MGMALLGTRMRRRARVGEPGAEAVPPVLNNTKNRRAETARRLWMVLGGVGFTFVLLSFAALCAIKFSVGLTHNPPQEWNDGRAPELEALVRKRCVKFMAKAGTPGLAVAIAQSTNTTVMAFGRQSLFDGAPVQGDTLFELGSITKTFTALTLAREIEQGTLQLDTPIQKLLPSDVKLPEEAKSVTLKNLTTHSSGFPRLPENIPALGFVKMQLLGSDPYEGYDETQLLAALRTVTLEFAPGTQWTYSNFGLMLLGYLLGRQTGTNCEDLIKDQICRPLGMSQTTMQLRREQQPHVAQGYRDLARLGPFELGLRSAPWFASGTLGGAGALRSSASDMLKYLRANMQPQGELANAIRESHRQLFKEDARRGIAMNWMRAKRKDLKSTMIWHDGETGGFCAFLGFTEDGQCGVVVLSNATIPVDGLGVALLRDISAK